MESVLSMIAGNAVVATLLALAVAAIGARWRNPGVLHVLWLLVLAKLLVPPTMELRLLPPAPAGLPSAVLASPASRPPAEAPPSVAAPGSRTPPSLRAPDVRAAVLAAIALGAALVLGTAAFRVARFRHLVRGASAAPEPLARRAAEIAAAMGIRRPPRIRLIPARIPPVLWPGSPCEILLPAPLADALTEDEMDALLAHELGHVRRRDHWTRAVELLATALFWWHPVVWWARRNLRAAEESCCDALVVRTLGERSRAYADALLKTIEFLTRAPHRPVPALATGAGDFHRLKERLTMIASRRTARPLSPLKHRAMLAIALSVLLVGPTWTAAESGSEKAPAAPERLADTAEMLSALEALQNESAELEQRILETNRQHRLLQLRMEELEAGRHALDLLDEAERLRKEGHAEEAEVLREQADLLQQLVASRRAEVESEHERNLVRLKIEAKLQALEMRRTAADLEARMRELAPPDGD